MKLLKLLLITALLCSTNTLRAQKYVGGDISSTKRMVQTTRMWMATTSTMF